MNPPESCLNLRFQICPEVAQADFTGRSLILLCDSLRMREINETSRQLLGWLDGTRSVQDIAREMSPAGGLLADITAALLDMESQGIIRRVAALKTERAEQMSTARYLANPEVSFRQEDDDGGILFHMEADAVEVINPTAVAIWQFLAAPRTETEIVDHLCAVCADADRVQVTQDVAEFIGSLLKKGFIGVLEEPA